MITWHYMKDGVQAGPASTEELRALLAAGSLPANTMVWRQGLAGWAPANTLTEFTGVPQPAPGVVAPAAAPAKSGNRTLIIVLCVLGGIVLLIGGCVTTCAIIATKKAREYSESAKKNPSFATLSLVASFHPDVQVVSKDEASGKITLRNKKSGEVVTFDTNNYSPETIATALDKFVRGQHVDVTKETPSTESTTTPASADESAPVDDAVASKMALAKLPAFLPPYPGASSSTATANELPGGMRAASYSGYTHDKPGAVVDFYEKKLLAAGFSIMGKNSEPNSNGSTDIVAGMASSPTRNVTVTATNEDDGRVHVEFAFSQLAK